MVFTDQEGTPLSIYRSLIFYHFYILFPKFQIAISLFFTFDVYKKLFYMYIYFFISLYTVKKIKTSCKTNKKYALTEMTVKKNINNIKRSFL